MNHLTPEEVEIVEHLRQQSEMLSKWIGPKPDEGRYKRYSAGYTLAADAIEQRAALAGQVVVLHEAYANLVSAISDVPICECQVPFPDHVPDCAWGNALKAWESTLALPPPEAVAMVQEWKEKAELLDALAMDARIHGHNGMTLQMVLRDYPGWQLIRDPERNRHKICRATKEASNG